MLTDFYMFDHQDVLLDCFVRRIDRIVTHDGVFHADDVLAVALLSRYINNDIEVVRTRDAATLEAAMQSPTTLLLDVGGVYDPKQLAFDHHQRGYTEKRPSTDLHDDQGVPYSSFGLIWRHFGRMVSLGKEAVYSRFDDILVKGIDAIDCGYKLKGNKNVMSVSQVISLHNPTAAELEEGTRMIPDSFYEAVKLATSIIERTLASVTAEVKAIDYVKRCIDTAEDKRIVVLDKFVPWREMMVYYKEPLFVVFKDVGGQWRVQTIPVNNADSFDSRKMLPESWAGLRDEALADASGIPDAVFCHIGRFIAGTRSKESAIRMATIAVNG